MIEKEKFERHLRGTTLSENTIASYLFAIKQYGKQYDDVTQKKLREYKVWLIESYKPKEPSLIPKTYAFASNWPLNPSSAICSIAPGMSIIALVSVCSGAKAF